MRCFKLREINVLLGLIAFTILLDAIGFGIIIPILPTLISKLTGTTDMGFISRVGELLVVTYSFAQFFCSPILEL